MVHSRSVRRFARVSFLPLVSLGLLAGWTSQSQAQTSEEGYRLLPGGTGVVVDRAEQWEKWTRPKHAVTIDPVAHTAAPRHIRKNVDVIEGIDQFRIKIGDEKAYKNLLDQLKKEGAAPPLNIVTGPASVAGVPIVYLKADAKKGIAEGDPVMWYFYQGGIREAPNNPDLAADILDGDPRTYWEPSTAVSQEEYEALPPAEQGTIYYFAKDAAGQERRVTRKVYEQTSSGQRRIQYNSRSLSTWYVDVELGRVVPVSKIVLRFVDGELGEPFRQSRILTTPTDERGAALSLTARTVTPNVDQREVVFDNLVANDPSRNHLLVYRLRIQVTDSKLDKFKEISEEEYLAMPVEDQGGIDYYIVDLGGGETKVDQEIYDQVSPQRRGRLVYYQRERPRLADIEVWSQGDNIALGIIGSGGSVDLLGPQEATEGFDGLYSTTFLQDQWLPDPRYQNGGILIVDLGAVFWVDALRWVGGIVDFNEFLTRASDGTRDTNGELKWTEIGRSEPGLYRADYEQTLERPLPIRYLWSRSTPNVETTERLPWSQNRFSEVQIFGEGYPPEVMLTSPLIELPGSVILGSIEWEADIPDPDLAEVEIRTRTGDRLIETTEYYGSSGDLKTEEDYNNLPKSFKGPVVTRKVPGGGWSNWSQKYLKSGDLVTSPSPRRFLQIQPKLISRSPDVAARIRSVRVNFLPPVALRTIAEIWPGDVPRGIPQDFEVYLKPIFVERDPNGQESRRFDELLLDAAPIQQIELLDVSVGQEADLQSGTGQNFTEVGWRLDPASGEKTYWFEDASGARFQALINPASGDTLKVIRGGMAAAGSSAAGSELLLRLPHKVGLLPQSEKSRIYNRIIAEEGEEVPVDENGHLLNEFTYSSLSVEQQGRVVYFQIAGTRPDGTPVQEEVTEFVYKSLEDSLKGEILYFRKLIGKGGEFPFDREGKLLDQAAYNRLPVNERGSIATGGELVRVRFKAEVLLNGTTIGVAIRDASAPEAWQQVDAGDATSLREGKFLSVSVPLSSRVVQDVVIAPNPFTPNADGINDQTQIRFDIGNLNADRAVRVEIFDLSGRPVWQQTRMGFGEQSFVWNGEDEKGQMVLPGVYLCKIKVDADAEEASRQVNYRVIAVAY